MQTNTDVVVIGAGLAGLTAAEAAARTGARVTLLEAHQPGGRATTVDRDGFRLNEGPHALYEGGPAETYLVALGVPLSGGAPAGPFYGRAGDDLHLLPVSASTLARTHLLSGRSKLRLARVMQTLPKLDAVAHRHETASTWLAGLGLPDDAAGVVRALTRVATYSNLLDDLSADAAISQLQGGLRGVRYLDGGWQRLVEGVRAAATEAGVDIRTRHPVTEVRSALDRYNVDAGGPTIAGRAVVVAAGGAATAARLLGTTLVETGWAERLGPPSSVSCLDLGLSVPARHPIVFGIDAPLYLSTHCPPADLAPEGHTLVSLLRYLPAADMTTADEDRATLLAHARLAGVEPQHIVMQRFLRRMTAVTAIPIPAAGGLAGRPGVDVPGRQGAFVAGDWVGPVGMLADATVASALDAGRRAGEYATAIIRDGEPTDFVGTASQNTRVAT
jgi:phytoene dehydrogenase-like protein